MEYFCDSVIYNSTFLVTALPYILPVGIFNITPSEYTLSN